MQEPSLEEDKIAKEIVDASIHVDSQLGPGLLESVYAVCLEDVLLQKGFVVEREKPIPVKFNDKILKTGFRADIIVNNKVLIELKSVEKFLGVHEAQILTYLKLSNLRLGFLLNFNNKLMKEGIKRFVKS